LFRPPGQDLQDAGDEGGEFGHVIAQEFFGGFDGDLAVVGDQAKVNWI